VYRPDRQDDPVPLPAQSVLALLVLPELDDAGQAARMLS
jgi:hypothetical protein